MELGLSKEERREVEDLRAFAHIPEKYIEDLWECLFFRVVEGALEGREVILPLLGTLALSQQESGEISFQFTPSPFLKETLEVALSRPEDAFETPLFELWGDKIWAELYKALERS